MARRSFGPAAMRCIVSNRIVFFSEPCTSALKSLEFVEVLAQSLPEWLRNLRFKRINFVALMIRIGPHIIP